MWFAKKKKILICALIKKHKRSFAVLTYLHYSPKGIKAQILLFWMQTRTCLDKLISHTLKMHRDSLLWSSLQVRNPGFQVWRWKELCKLEVNSTFNLKCSLWAGESFRATVGLHCWTEFFYCQRYDSRVVPNVFKL